jgi:hypothetical protein
MSRYLLLILASFIAACTKIPSEPPQLSHSSGARCAEFTRLSTDMATTAYRRATAVEQLRAMRCPGYQ